MENNYGLILHDGETLLRTYRIAPISFLVSFIIGIFCIFMVLIGLGVSASDKINGGNIVIFFIPLTLLCLIPPILYIIFNALHLTNKRIILKVGPFGQYHHEIDLGNIQNLSYKKTALGGLLFNYANIHIYTSGSTIDQIKFPSVYQPDQVIASIKQQIEGNKLSLQREKTTKITISGSVFCPKCGRENDEDDMFCRACGNGL